MNFLMRKEGDVRKVQCMDCGGQFSESALDFEEPSKYWTEFMDSHIECKKVEE